RRATSSQPVVVPVEDPPDVLLKEDPLLIQNRRLSALVLVLGVLVIGAVLIATDPSRSIVSEPFVAAAGQPGSSLFIDEPTPETAAGGVLLAENIATAIPVATEAPRALQTGGTLAYVVRERGQSDIYAVGLNTGTPIRLTNAPDDERDPAWNSAGDKLAYASRQDGNWEIYTYDVLEDETTRITFDLAFQGNPQWSDDGLWLSYESYLNGNLDIFAVPVNGSSAPLQITTDLAADFSPDWNPATGRQMAFVSLRDGNPDIYTIDLDTLDVTNVTTTPGRAEKDPSWSPDGQYLAYSALDAGREKVFVKNLNNPTAAPEVVAFGRTPSWSPDGQSLTFAVDADDGSQTYLYAILYPRQGVPSTEVIATVYGATDPVWSAQTLPPALVNSGGLPIAVEPLFIEQEQIYDIDAPYRLNTLLEVEAELPLLSDRVNDSFNAMRPAVIEASGVDFLGTLDDAWWDLERLPEPGEPRRNWLMTGRAFALNRSSILGFPPDIEVVREDVDTNICWRIYLRVEDDFQDGQLGEPLRQLPWDLLSRNQGDVDAYNQGGRLRQQIPEGYYVDLTQLAASYGWQRMAAGSDWRANSNGINYWMFLKPEGLNWYDAMLEIHTEGSMINFDPISPQPPVCEPGV
ncbi:MAG: TolB family protein, partial [Aggregatilineales bacterium]